MEPFRKLGIGRPILRTIQEQGFEIPTEIQVKAIPPILKGNDVIVGAATGSGKTLAFGTGIIQKALAGRGIQALVLTPTRELALQVSKALTSFSKYAGLKTAVVYGGVAYGPQIRKMQRADVVVGTPGRILDHLSQKVIDFSKVSILVLDEADRMLDMGFIKDVDSIIRACPSERQTILCSATVSADIAHIARRYLHEPIRVAAKDQVDPEKLRQVCYDVPENLKFSLLVHFLKHEHVKLAMVFCNTRSGVDFVADNLKSAEIPAQAIHGGFTQAKRERTMEKFHTKRTQVLVCTDVAARGLDIKGVSHIYNYDIPREPKQYIHRIGRTARAGRSGKAITLRTRRQKDNLSRILKSYKLPMTLEKTPKFGIVEVVRKSSFRKGPRSRAPRRRPPARKKNLKFRF